MKTKTTVQDIMVRKCRSDHPSGFMRTDGTYTIQQDSIPYSPVKNAKSSFFNTGIQTQNGLTYAVGDDKSNFYISFQDVLIPRYHSKGPEPERQFSY